MKILPLKTMLKLFLTSVYTLTFFTLTAQDIPEPCCQEECESRMTLVNTLPFIGGALIAGGAAIALNKGSHDGHSGPKGNTGGQPNFDENKGQFIIFNFLDLDLMGVADVDITQDGLALTLQPYVTLPNGTTIEGEAVPMVATSQDSVSFQFILANANLGPLRVSNPVEGTYKAGVQIVNITPGVNAFDLTTALRVDVFTSRDDKWTTTLERDIIFANPASPLPTNGQLQVATNFVYGGDIP